MDVFTCSHCGERCVRDKKLGKTVCQKCGKVNKYAFISYSSENIEIVNSIRDIFLSQQIPVWMTPHDIHAGDDYFLAIDTAIENCTCFVLVLTNEAQNSPWVPREVELAINWRKHLIPIQLQLEPVVLNRKFNVFMRNVQIEVVSEVSVHNSVFQGVLKDLKERTKEQFVEISPSEIKSGGEMEPPAPPVEEHKTPVSPVSPPPAPEKSKKERKKKDASRDKGPAFPDWIKAHSKVLISALTAVLIISVLILMLTVAAVVSGKKESEPTVSETTEQPIPTGKKIPNPWHHPETEPPVQSDQWKENILRGTGGKYNYNSRHLLDSDYSPNHIVSITFLDSLQSAPEAAWDVSEAQNGSVLAWVGPSSDRYMYNLFIAGEGGVCAPADCEYLFGNFFATKSIDFNDCFYVTSDVTSMYKMFDGCSALTLLDVSNFDTSNVTNMSAMFSKCGALTSLDVSNFDTSNVTDMGKMFADCISLTSLDVSNFNTSRVTDMGCMFNSCIALTALDVSSFDTSKVVYMNGMFSLCEALTALDVSSFDTSEVVNMASMFNSCKALTTLDVSNFDTSGVDLMAYMFANCPADIELGTWDTYLVSFYSNFMDSGRIYNGRPWEELFQ